jgi:GGDEF domain-containing protein
MSLTTYVQPEPAGEPASAWPDLALGLLRDFREHAICLKEEERDDLQRELDEVVRALQTKPATSVIQACAATLADKIPEYLAKTQKEVNNSLSELRQLANVLMTSLTQVEQADQSTSASLAEIGQIVQDARSPGELAVAKIHLMQALARLRTQTEARREANHQLLTALEEKARALELAPDLEATLHAAVSESGVSSEQNLVAAIGPADPITGLLGRQAAEAFLMSMPEKAKAKSYVVAFYVQRMELINSRFGDRIGTDVLCYCAQHFAKVVEISDHLFRWRGPGFVAVLSRGRSLSEVKQEINAAHRTRMAFEGVDNSVIIPLSIVSQIWPTRKMHSAEIVHHIETFFSQPSTRGLVGAPETMGNVELDEEELADDI